MYDYRPIGIYSSKTLADEERIKKNNYENPTSNQQQKSQKRNINLLIVTDYYGKHQFEDLYYENNQVWEIRQISSFANYETFVDLCRDFNFKNICVIHHGNVYSDKNISPSDAKVVINSTNFNLLRKSFENLDKKDLMALDDVYFENFRKETEKYASGGFKLIEIKAYLSLRLIFSKMLDNSTFISFACDEADDKKTLEELGEMTDKQKIKIYTNSNYTDIQTQAWEMIEGKKFFFGSALNKLATNPGEWKDKSGWVYLDKLTNKIITTKKDLWIYSSSKSKVYDLYSREKDFTKEQYNRIIYTQKYFSKKYRKMYQDKYGKVKFEEWKAATEKAYPELKR